jgi:thimet oligopeptidase
LDLPEEQLEQVSVLKNKLTEFETQFQMNIAQDNRTLTVSLEQLKGLPDDFIATLGKTEEGLFVLKSNYPTQSIIMRECVQSATRKAFSLMMQQRGYPKNVEVLNQVIELRKQLATLLGFESYADLSLAQAMINKPADAVNLQKDLLPKALEKAQKEFELFKKDLPEGVKLSENGKFYSWDYGYTVNYYKKKYYDIDEEKLAEYFPMQETIDGLFKIYQQFFGLSFKEIKNPQSWHPEVRLLEISKQDGPILGYVFRYVPS